MKRNEHLLPLSDESLQIIRGALVNLESVYERQHNRIMLDIVQRANEEIAIYLQRLNQEAIKRFEKEGIEW